MDKKVKELLEKDPKTIMRSIIQRVATGPELSKDISLEEARAGMRSILDGEIDPVQSAIFLIALRMKRETDEENIGVLDGILDVTNSVTAPVDEVLDIADPFDGYNRTLPAAPFLPAVLAACGVNSFTHGVKTLGPKFGITHHLVLEAAGVPVDLSTEDAATRLGSPDIGWTYVDQKTYCPKLHDLTAFRTLVIKRPALTTVEVLASPIKGRKKTHFMTGYVHKPYPRVYALLARHAGFDSCLLVRGIEGGIIPSLRQTGKMVYYHEKGEEQGQEFTPEDIGIHQNVRSTPLPDDLPPKEKADTIGVDFDTHAAAKIAVKAGLAALKGEQSATYDALVYSGALALWHLRKHDTLADAANKVRDALNNGDALNHFTAAKN